ncbi:DNase I-like protein [Neolentinus lepideus HHB14362 ss-1]|uniref:DNase I-like protein n=1 Tax=Neolentinus lepideus HHB14362 ss-1 TaxID=1314782 RepID=A0A165TAN8_9AGAM|nr:DNase I-like protein [Neolentinus lepideus HHB14362 ss-1]
MSIQNQDRLLVQIASYNTNLQGIFGLPQDLVDWLSPTLQVSNFLSREPRAPDIVAVGFQELLPLHLGFSGLSKRVINNRDALILSQIEAHAPNKEKYILIAKIVNVGVALLVYGRDDGVGRKLCDVQTQWTGSGPLYLGNKGAVGVRFRVPADDGGTGEVFTFVCAHLTAHEHKLSSRIADYHHIVRTLLFPPLPSTASTDPTTMYSTSHLFFFGDLNFRVSLPPSHPLQGLKNRAEFVKALDSDADRQSLKEYDQLLVERTKGSAFVGLREGEFWRFKCTYKHQLGEVEKYSPLRAPSWTDRVLYATHTDSPETPTSSNIKNLLYTSIPSYTTSDHKPIISLLLLPAPAPSTPTAPPPTLRLPPSYTPTPDPLATPKRYLGRVLDRVLGIAWLLTIIVGAGSAVLGLGAILGGSLFYAFWRWWRARAFVIPIESAHAKMLEGYLKSRFA